MFGFHKPQFTVDDVTFAYPGFPPCVDGVSFVIAPGERVALLGANGCGKSTLLHLLDGLYFPTAGCILYGDDPLTELALERPPLGPRFRQQVGMLFQHSDAQLFNATVEDEVAFAPLQLGWPGADIRRRVTDVLQLLEIAHLRTRVPQSLSGGEKKRVALASLLVLRPEVLLLDEPTAGLDPRSQSRLIEILGLLHEAGMTLVTTTHDLALLPYLADRAIVMGEDHHIVADAPVAAILADEALLLRTNLLYVHAHRHDGVEHVHPQHSLLHAHGPSPSRPGS